MENDHTSITAGQSVQGGPEALLTLSALLPRLRQLRIAAKGQEQPGGVGGRLPDLLLTAIASPFELPAGRSPCFSGSQYDSNCRFGYRRSRQGINWPAPGGVQTSQAYKGPRVAVPSARSPAWTADAQRAQLPAYLARSNF